MPAAIPYISAIFSVVSGKGGSGGGLLQQIAVAIAVNQLSRVMASRPPDAARPDPELLASLGPFIRPDLLCRGITATERIDCFGGLKSCNPDTMASTVGIGGCLEPEYPDGRTLYFHDESQEPRSGDLAIIENWERRARPKLPPARGIRMSRGFGGVVVRERVQRVKYVERVDARWLLHSNDEPFWLDRDMKFAGRVVMAVVVPDAAILRSLLDAAVRAA